MKGQLISNAKVIINIPIEGRNRAGRNMFILKRSKKIKASQEIRLMATKTVDGNRKNW